MKIRVGDTDIIYLWRLKIKIPCDQYHTRIYSDMSNSILECFLKVLEGPISGITSWKSKLRVILPVHIKIPKIMASFADPFKCLWYLEMALVRALQGRLIVLRIPVKFYCQQKMDGYDENLMKLGFALLWWTLNL